MTAGARGKASRVSLLTSWRSGPLAVREFRLLSLGQFASTVGDACYAVALPWFVLSAHGGAVLLGTVLACYGVPRTVLIPVGGVLADKFGPRAVMLAADATRCLLVAVLAVLAARHMDSLALLGPIAALLGAGEGAFIPASYSIMPALLQPEQLAAGNSLFTALLQLGTLGGPVLGGLLVGTAGPAPAFAIDAASFAVSAGALILLRAPRPVQEAAVAAQADGALPVPDEPAGPQQAASQPPAASPQAAEPGAASSVWSLLRQSRLLQIIVGVCIVANLSSGGTFEVALPDLAHKLYAAAGYGALVACFGGGAAVGTLAAARAGRLPRPGATAMYVFLAEAVAASLVPFAGGLAGACAAIAIFGMCNGFGNVVVVTLLQQWAPQQLLGRVMSLVMLAAIGVFPISVAVAGVLVRQFGPTPFFPAAGLVLAVPILAGLCTREIRNFGVQAGQPSQSDHAAVLAR